MDNLIAEVISRNKAKGEMFLKRRGGYVVTEKGDEKV